MYPIDYFKPTYLTIIKMETDKNTIIAIIVNILYISL